VNTESAIARLLLKMFHNWPNYRVKLRRTVVVRRENRFEQSLCVTESVFNGRSDDR
jgi:hypothetical protein